MQLEKHHPTNQETNIPCLQEGEAASH